MAFMLVVEESIHFLSGTNWLVVNRIKREAAKGQGENEEKLTKKLPFWYWNLWIFFFIVEIRMYFGQAKMVTE